MSTITLYHGTNKRFTAFDMAHAATALQPNSLLGVHLNSNPSNAACYAEEMVDDGNPVVLEVQVHVERVMGCTSRRGFMGYTESEFEADRPIWDRLRQPFSDARGALLAKGIDAIAFSLPADNDDVENDDLFGNWVILNPARCRIVRFLEPEKAHQLETGYDPLTEVRIEGDFKLGIPDLAVAADSITSTLKAEYLAQSAEIVVWRRPGQRAHPYDNASAQSYADALDDLRASTLNPEVHRMVEGQLKSLFHHHGVRPTLSPTSVLSDLAACSLDLRSTSPSRWRAHTKAYIARAKTEAQRSSGNEALYQIADLERCDGYYQDGVLLKAIAIAKTVLDDAAVSTTDSSPAPSPRDI